MRVQCATYNGHLGQGHSVLSYEGEGEDLASWLNPTLLPDGSERGEAPDIVAVGFQEMIPLHLALAGFTSTALDLHEDKIKLAIERTHTKTEAGGGGTTYSLISRKSLGGIALLVYSSDQTLTSRLQEVRVATAGCGVFGFMGNKGAVGIRFSLKGEEGEGDSLSSWTFVTAHLAAHQEKVERRNWDWKEIVQRLVFVSEKTGKEESLYETGHLFVFGDLNYRISLTSPRKLAPHLLSHHISTLVSPLSDSSSLSSSLSTLLPHDQLHQQLSRQKTLHHLSEAPITFPPTYKFKPGTRETYKDFRKRVPGWCDRILYAVAESETEGFETEMYRSEMDFTASDHKPVTALFNIPSPSSSSLPVKSPYPISPTWRQSQTLGMLLDRLVGLIWCVIMLAGLNKDVRLGIVNLGGLAVGGWVYKFGGVGWRLLS
ncbi:phosphoinositide 5-phosphatase INP54 [Sporobolomyces salmoneus]|uniref:phosphoinositide 5-phosphatase INP54 n=1 Tax=Sporobolomyces salmoneus TaxID=183962 RepID=UPI003175A8A4